MSVRYTLDSENAVNVFYDDSTVPSLYQPHWPNGDAWADAAEATAWAELYVASITDEDAPYAPNVRGETGRAKPTAAQRAVIEAAVQAGRDATTAEEVEAADVALKAAYKAYTDSL